MGRAPKLPLPPDSGPTLVGATGAIPPAASERPLEETDPAGNALTSGLDAHRFSLPRGQVVSHAPRPGPHTPPGDLERRRDLRRHREEASLEMPEELLDALVVGRVATELDEDLEYSPLSVVSRLPGLGE